MNGCMLHTAGLLFNFLIFPYTGKSIKGDAWYAS